MLKMFDDDWACERALILRLDKKTETEIEHAKSDRNLFEPHVVSVPFVVVGSFFTLALFLLLFSVYYLASMCVSVKTKHRPRELSAI